MPRLPLRSQLALATFVPLLIFALLGGGVGAYALQKVPQDAILARQDALTQVAAAGIAGSLRGHVRLLQVTADELGMYVGYPQLQQQVLQSQAGVLGVFSGGVALLDRRGTALAVTPGQEASIGLNYAFRPYFGEVKASATPVFSAVLRDYPAGFSAVVMAVPVLRGSAFDGALVGEFALDRPDWASDLDLLRTAAGGVAYLVDTTGTVIYHPDRGRIGADLAADLWTILSGAGGGGGSLYRPAAGDRAPLLVTYAPIPGSAWGVVVEEPWGVILATIAPYRWAAGGLLALGMLLALTALVASVNRVTQPLGALIAEGERVAAGQAFQPLAEAGPPDLRTLIAVVNRMVARLGEQGAALHRYARQVLRSQEEERLRLSRELHDETVQDLVALAQRIELCSELAEENPAAVGAELRGLGSLAYDTLTGVRRMSRDLRPFVLEDLGLPAALQAICRELEPQLGGGRVSCEIVGRAERLPAELELTAFRVAQEALNNVRKHAATAARVNVALFYEDWGVQLMVEDNGPGFQPTDRETLLRAGHLGLAGMAERAQLFGGQVDVTSAPGAGATVALRLPVTR